jgi:sugar phosphate isomerase/epimerase
MRFGTYVGPAKTPEEQAVLAQLHGYTATGVDSSMAGTEEARKNYVQVMREYNVQISEVGAWSNPLAPFPQARKEALEVCKRNLLLADQLNARCCVNISGSLGTAWDGPHRDNLTSQTFEMVVESVREIIDAVKPTRTFYTLETMPWMYPESADSYVALIKAVDRKAFAVHFDPVNLISSPQLYFANGQLISDFVKKLGPHIRCVHVKDIRLRDNLTIHLEEVRPGTGNLDHATLFKELSRLDPETPVLMEHLAQEDYPVAAQYLRAVAASVGVKI